MPELTRAGDPSPFLWGDWRCGAEPGFWTAMCAACGGALWVWAVDYSFDVNENGDDVWQSQPTRVSCANGCARDAIEAACLVWLSAQREQQTYEDELRATLDITDPFYTLSIADCIETLTGEEASRGFFRCPFHGNGQERTPSLHVSHDSRPGIWYCHGCHEGGTIYDFAGLLWGIEPRGDGFEEIRRGLVAQFGGVTGAPVKSMKAPHQDVI